MHRRCLAVSILLGVVVLTVGFAGCNGSDDVMGTGNSQVRVLLTDAPSDLIASAKVTISRIYLVGEDGVSVDLKPAVEPHVTYELFDLRNGVEAFLADRRVPAANYGQLRLVVEEADVTLVDGVTFEDGTSSRTLHVPSGMRSGIKVQLSTPLEAEAGELTIVVVDFDVDRNFVLQGNPDTPAGLKTSSSPRSSTRSGARRLRSPDPLLIDVLPRRHPGLAGTRALSLSRASGSV
jgi:hypothetical protein